MAVRYHKSAPVGQYQPLHITQPGTFVPVGASVSTTSPTTITAGSSVVVTPVSMNNIVPQMMLGVANGMGTAEDVQVLSTTSTTFTANFQYSHSGAYTILSLKGANLGHIVVNNPGSGVTLTLYNGHPYNVPAGSAFAEIAIGIHPMYQFNCTADYGLLYTVAVTGGGTMADLTLMYLDQIV